MRRLGFFIPCDWTDAGMPDVEDQKRAVGGARDSISDQRDCFVETDSGPCSCTMFAADTASARDGERMRVWLERGGGREMRSVVFESQLDVCRIIFSGGDGDRYPV